MSTKRQAEWNRVQRFAGYITRGLRPSGGPSYEHMLPLVRILMHNRPNDGLLVIERLVIDWFSHRGTCDLPKLRFDGRAW